MTAQLDKARDEFQKRLSQITSIDLRAPTPCSDWTVRELINHVVAGDHMSVHLLNGGSAEQALSILHTDWVAEDPMVAFLDAADRQRVAVQSPGAMTRRVNHPMGEFSGEQVLNLRIADYLLHAWDLARSITADERLDTGLVAAVWDALQPVAPVIGQLGVFGAGPSGHVGRDASLQEQLLDLTGRRP